MEADRMTPEAEDKAWLATDDASSADVLPEDLADLVKPELQPGERLLWAAKAMDRPPPGTAEPHRVWIVTLVGFGIAGGSFYAIFGPPRPRFVSAEGLFIGTGLIATIVGLIAGIAATYSEAEWWGLHGRFARNTYALTDRRAIIWIPLPHSKAVEVHTFPRASIKTIYRLEYPDGYGSVRFGHPTDELHEGPHGFEGVADVRLVEDLVRRTLFDPGPHSST
jgi:hypothetical protein